MRNFSWIQITLSNLSDFPPRFPRHHQNEDDKKLISISICFHFQAALNPLLSINKISQLRHLFPQAFPIFPFRELKLQVNEKYEENVRWIFNFHSSRRTKWKARSLLLFWLWILKTKLNHCFPQIDVDVSLSLTMHRMLFVKLYQG